jgi:hypothetical protein
MERSLPLVLVEGVPFTGKSTVSEYIAQQLSLNGYPQQWLPEGTMLKQYFPHVLATFDGAPLSEEMLWQNWSTFVETVRSRPETFVVDSALSYTAIFRLMLDDRPTAQVLAWLERLATLCAPLQPRIIHLVGDVDHLARASIVERGAEWEEQMIKTTEPTPYQQTRGRTGVAGAISMMDDTQALTRRVLAAGWQSLTVDVTAGEWPIYQRAILDFLGIPEVVVTPPEIPQALLQVYAGDYAPVEADETLLLLTIRLEEGTLALYGTNNAYYGSLIPLTDNRFHLRASGVDIAFEQEAGQQVFLQLVPLSSDGKRRRFQKVDGS